jgi:hypothetical protein
MGIFAIGIEHPLDMTIERLHDTDPRHHRQNARVSRAALHPVWNALRRARTLGI